MHVTTADEAALAVAPGKPGLGLEYQGRETRNITTLESGKRMSAKGESI